MVTNSLLIFYYKIEAFSRPFFIFCIVCNDTEVIITDINTESIGFLTVEVKTANGAIPIEGATVYVYPATEGSDLLYSLRTNQSGQSERVALDTKDKKMSQVPGIEQPYTLYNVSVSAPGYYFSEKSSIPIFEGVNSILPFDLIPLSEGANPESFEPDGIGRFSKTPSTDL